MIVGKLTWYINKLNPGQSLILDYQVVLHSAMATFGSSIRTRTEHDCVEALIKEINNDEYKDFKIFELADAKNMFKLSRYYYTPH